MNKKEKQFVEEMQSARGIDFARLGMKVEVSGEIGTIAGMNCRGNLDVVFANQIKMGAHKHNCHPTWDITYYDANGEVIAAYPA